MWQDGIHYFSPWHHNLNNSLKYYMVIQFQFTTHLTKQKNMIKVQNLTWNFVISYLQFNVPFWNLNPDTILKDDVLLLYKTTSSFSSLLLLHNWISFDLIDHFQTKFVNKNTQFAKRMLFIPTKKCSIEFFLLCEYHE